MATAKERVRGYLFGRPLPRPQSRAEQWRTALVAGVAFVVVMAVLAVLTNDRWERPAVSVTILFLVFTIGMKLAAARRHRRQFGPDSSTWL